MSNLPVAKCKTCEFNFKQYRSPSVCANTYYGDSIKDIMKEKRVCDGWSVSLNEFLKKNKGV